MDAKINSNNTSLWGKLSSAFTDLFYRVPGVDIAGTGLAFRQNLRRGDEHIAAQKQSLSNPMLTGHRLGAALDCFSTAQSLLAGKCGIARQMCVLNQKVDDGLTQIKNDFAPKVRASLAGGNVEELVGSLVHAANQARVTSVAIPEVPKTKFGIPIPGTSRMGLINAICERVGSTKAAIVVSEVLAPIMEKGSAEQRAVAHREISRLSLQ